MVVYVRVDAEIFFLFHFHFRTYSVYTMEQQYSASTMEQDSSPPPPADNWTADSLVPPS